MGCFFAVNVEFLNLLYGFHIEVLTFLDKNAMAIIAIIGTLERKAR